MLTPLPRGNIAVVKQGDATIKQAMILMAVPANFAVFSLRHHNCWGSLRGINSVPALKAQLIHVKPTALGLGRQNSLSR